MSRKKKPVRFPKKEISIWVNGDAEEVADKICIHMEGENFLESVWKHDHDTVKMKVYALSHQFLRKLLDIEGVGGILTDDYYFVGKRSKVLSEDELELPDMGRMLRLNYTGDNDECIEGD